MQKTKRELIKLIATIPVLLGGRPTVAQTASKALVSIVEARTTGLVHTLSISTRAVQDSLRILAVYRLDGWQPALITPPKSRVPQLALATKVPEFTSPTTPSFGASRRWELTFEERAGLPKETYVIACRISDVHGGRSLREELPDVRRILSLVNEPTPSQRDKTIEDVLRALFEFDWEPVGYTQLTIPARRA